MLTIMMIIMISAMLSGEWFPFIFPFSDYLNIWIRVISQSAARRRRFTEQIHIWTCQISHSQLWQLQQYVWWWQCFNKCMFSCSSSALCNYNEFNKYFVLSNEFQVNRFYLPFKHICIICESVRFGLESEFS